jgi:3-demethylubiquinone-9 3-methyltransferase
MTNTLSGTVDLLTIEFSGQEFRLLGAGPLFKFTPAVSFLVACETKEEVDASAAARGNIRSVRDMGGRGPIRPFLASDVHGRAPNRTDDHADAHVCRGPVWKSQRSHRNRGPEHAAARHSQGARVASHSASACDPPGLRRARPLHHPAATPRTTD